MKPIRFFHVVRAALAAGVLVLAACNNLPQPGSARSEAPPAALQPVAASSLASPAPAPSLDPALLNAPSEAYRLGPGDRLEIELMGDPATRATTVVGPDGRIYYYLLPGIDVWGMTLVQVRDRLVSELQRYVRQKPVLSLTLRAAESQRVWVLGRVNSPGVYTLAGPTTLLEAISQAGGLSSASPFASLAASLGISSPAGSTAEAADLGRAFVIRKGALVPVDFTRLLREGDLSQNIYVQPGDFVFLPSTRVPEVHVLGAVVQPRSERMPNTLTVVQAIALAGGAFPDACLSNVAILRGSLAHPDIAIIPVNEVLHGRSPDVRLEPGDIVYVPYTPYRTLLRYTNLILDTFVRTVGVNEGAHAVSSNSASVGVNVSVTP